MKRMIHIFLIAIVAVGCSTKNENAELKTLLADLAEENAMLAQGNVDLEISVEVYQALLVEIDENLAAIDDKHTTVSEQIAGNGISLEEDIQLHLEHIHGNLENSKYKVAQMQEELYKLYELEQIDEAVILELEMELDDAAEEIFIRDAAIVELHETVVEEDIEIAVLVEAYNKQEVISEVLYAALNTAYFIAGTKKELKDYGIIDAEGGFLGMGRVKSLAADADVDFFVPIPMDITDEIDLLCKKAKLLTNHPESSYSLSGDKEIEILEILDKAAFWDKSDFLIIEIIKE
jgi:hypothetical protein